MNAIPPDRAAFDIGPKTVEMFRRMTRTRRRSSGTVPWASSRRSRSTPARSAWRSSSRRPPAFTVVGGGESVEAVVRGGARGQDLARLDRRRARRSTSSRARSSRRRGPAVTPPVAARRLLVANWKMTRTPSAAAALAARLAASGAPPAWTWPSRRPSPRSTASARDSRARASRSPRRTSTPRRRAPSPARCRRRC